MNLNTFLIHGITQQSKIQGSYKTAVTLIQDTLYIIVLTVKWSNCTFASKISPLGSSFTKAHTDTDLHFYFLI